MTETQYERPVIVKLNSGMMNKFGYQIAVAVLIVLNLVFLFI